MKGGPPRPQGTPVTHESTLWHGPCGFVFVFLKRAWFFTGSAHPHPPHQWTAGWAHAKCQPGHPPQALGFPPSPAPPAQPPLWLGPCSEAPLGTAGTVVVQESPAREGPCLLSQEPRLHPQADSSPLREAGDPQHSSESKLYSGSWQEEGAAAPQIWCGPRWLSVAGEER